jgi:hypothetical protein
MDGGQNAAWRNSKDRAVVARPTTAGCSVEVPVESLDKSPKGIVTVRLIEIRQDGERLRMHRNRGEKTKQEQYAPSSRSHRNQFEYPFPPGS